MGRKAAKDDAQEQKERLIAEYADQAVSNVEEYYEKFEKPLTSGNLNKPFRGILYRQNLKWSEIVTHLQKTKKVHVELDHTNTRLFYPKDKKPTDMDMRVLALEQMVMNAEKERKEEGES